METSCSDYLVFDNNNGADLLRVVVPSDYVYEKHNQDA